MEESAVCLFIVRGCFNRHEKGRRKGKKEREECDTEFNLFIGGLIQVEK